MSGHDSASKHGGTSWDGDHMAFARLNIWVRVIMFSDWRPKNLEQSHDTSKVEHLFGSHREEYSRERISKSPHDRDLYELFEWLFPTSTFVSTVSVRGVKPQWKTVTCVTHVPVLDLGRKLLVWTGRQDVEETLCCLQLWWVGCTQMDSLFFFVQPHGCAVRWTWWKVCFFTNLGIKNNAAKWLMCVGNAVQNCKAPLNWYDIQVGQVC